MISWHEYVSANADWRAAAAAERRGALCRAIARFRPAYVAGSMKRPDKIASPCPGPPALSPPTAGLDFVGVPE
jgi:hypothetical protein